MKPSVSNLVERWHTAFLGGRDIPAEELCRESPELLSELRSVLAATRSAIGRAAGTMLAPQVPLTQAGDYTLPASQPPPMFDLMPKNSVELDRVGDYKLVRVLGQGGMGIVYEAEDTRLGRRVAVKRMRPEVAADADHRRRFVREARAVAALAHDHVVPIYAVGEHDEAPYLVMPLLEGENLSVRLARQRKLSVVHTIRLGRQTAEGLAAAHAKGLMHRDIKPGNLWLEPGGPFRVRILDFGLARSASTDDAVTKTGEVAGTPAFMAPEQARGDAGDPRGDLFSLGSVLYKCLTVVSPFERGNVTATLTALALDTPVAPCDRDGSVPEDLSDLVMELLEKDAADRPQTARAVADALTAMSRRKDDKTSIVREKPPARVRKAAKREPWKWRAAVGVGLVVFGAALFAVFGGGPPPVPAPPLPPAPNAGGPVDLNPLIKSILGPKQEGGWKEGEPKFDQKRGKLFKGG